MATIQISKPTNFEYNTNNQDSSFDYNNAITANSECNLPIPFTDKLGKWTGNKYTKTSTYTNKSLYTISNNNVATELDTAAKKNIAIKDTYIKSSDTSFNYLCNSSQSNNPLADTYSLSNGKYSPVSSVSLNNNYYKWKKDNFSLNFFKVDTSHSTIGNISELSITKLKELNQIETSLPVIYEMGSISNDEITIKNTAFVGSDNTDYLPHWKTQGIVNTSLSKLEAGHLYFCSCSRKGNLSKTSSNYPFWFEDDGVQGSETLVYSTNYSFPSYAIIAQSTRNCHAGFLFTVKDNLFSNEKFLTHVNSIDIEAMSTNTSLNELTSACYELTNTYALGDFFYKNTINFTSNNNEMDNRTEILFNGSSNYYNFTSIARVGNNSEFYRKNGFVYESLAQGDIPLASGENYYLQAGVEYDIRDLYKISSGDISSSNYILLSPEEEINRFTRRQKKAPYGAFFVAYRFFTVLQR